jgi:ferric-dicitrate binding protein FerR (iron transport regulator)
MRQVIGAAVIAAVLSGCASSEPARPNVAAYPTRGQNAAQQARDNTECQTWARQQSGHDPAKDTATGAGVGLAVGAVAGAATGAAIGAATGSAGRGAAVGAVVGGVGGTAAGAGYGYTRNRDGYDRAYAACMQGRGYSIAR